MWAVQARVAISKDSWQRWIDLPTFYLDENVQGILNADQAYNVARDIIDPVTMYENRKILVMEV